MADVRTTSAAELTFPEGGHDHYGRFRVSARSGHRFLHVGQLVTPPLALWDANIGSVVQPSSERRIGDRAVTKLTRTEYNASTRIMSYDWRTTVSHESRFLLPRCVEAANLLCPDKTTAPVFDCTTTTLCRDTMKLLPRSEDGNQYSYSFTPHAASSVEVPGFDGVKMLWFGPECPSPPEVRDQHFADIKAKVLETKGEYVQPARERRGVLEEAEAAFNGAYEDAIDADALERRWGDSYVGHHVRSWVNAYNARLERALESGEQDEIDKYTPLANLATTTHDAFVAYLEHKNALEDHLSEHGLPENFDPYDWQAAEAAVFTSAPFRSGDSRYGNFRHTVSLDNMVEAAAAHYHTIAEGTELAGDWLQPCWLVLGTMEHKQELEHTLMWVPSRDKAVLQALGFTKAARRFIRRLPLSTDDSTVVRITEAGVVQRLRSTSASRAHGEQNRPWECTALVFAFPLETEAVQVREEYVETRGVNYTGLRPGKWGEIRTEEQAQLDEAIKFVRRAAALPQGDLDIIRNIARAGQLSQQGTEFMELLRSAPTWVNLDDSVSYTAAGGQ